MRPYLTQRFAAIGAAGALVASDLLLDNYFAIAYLSLYGALIGGNKGLKLDIEDGRFDPDFRKRL